MKRMEKHENKKSEKAILGAVKTIKTIVDPDAWTSKNDVIVRKMTIDGKEAIVYM